MKKFLITDPSLYTQEPQIFEERLGQSLKRHMPDVAIFRDKSTSEYETLACGFLKITKEMAILAYLHGDINVAKKLGADGVHLTSGQFAEIPHAKSFGLACGVSAHSFEDIALAQSLGADYVTFSPIFATPNKGEPKGIEMLAEAVALFEIPIIALGGIVEEWHVEQIASSGAYGFASIRYFAPA